MKRIRSPKRTWGDAVETSALLVGLLFLAELMEYLLAIPLDQLGIQPRTMQGLIGIVFSPFLHGSSGHLLANALPLFILLVLLFWDHRYHPDHALLLIWFGSGLGTWLIGRPAIHIGASSIIYGLVAYLIAAGWWMRNWRSVIVAVLVLFFYGGLFYGMLPQPGIMSWEGHLSGAVAGWWAARKNHG